MSESPTANTIARERVDNLATRNAEPAWLKQLRLNAWESYFKTPMPTGREEDWRRLEIDALDLTSLKTVDLPGTAKQRQDDKLPEYFQTALKIFKSAAGIVAETDHASFTELSAEAQKRGVVFCSLKTALEEHPDLIRPYLEMNPASDAKFTLLNQALFNSGSFLYIPSNVEVAEPFLSLVDFALKRADESVAIFPRTIIVLGPNSKADIICSVSTQELEKSHHLSLSNAAVEVHLGDGAKLNYVELHKFAAHTFAIARNRYHVSGNASLYSLTVGLGGGQIKADLTTELSAPGAYADIEGVVLGDDNEHFSFNTVLDHDAPDTKSDINFRVALKDRASSAYLGSIRVAKVAQRTNAYQSNKNLLLGSEARADSIPKLEILADDVKCSHGATVGPVDKEQIFYLMSRGLTRSESEELIVSGFFRTVFDSCKIPGVTDYIGNLVGDKIQIQKQVIAK